MSSTAFELSLAAKRSPAPASASLALQAIAGLVFLGADCYPLNATSCCLAAVYWLLFADSCRQRSACARSQNFVIGGGLILWILLVLPCAFSLNEQATPRTFDTALRRWDLALGLDGFALSRFCFRHMAAQLSVEAVYFALPLAIALAWVVSRSWRFLAACILGGIAGWFCYLLCPATGPEMAFRGWPSSGAATLLSPEGPRNCMPSLHFAWALFCAFNTRGAWRIAFGGFALLTAFAAVACGQHYFVDMVAAVPFASLVQFTAEALRRRVPASLRLSGSERTQA